MLGISFAVDCAILFCPHCRAHALVGAHTVRLFGRRLVPFIGVRLYRCEDCERHFPGVCLG